MNRDTICVQGGYTPGNGDVKCLFPDVRDFLINLPQKARCHSLKSNLR